MDLELQSAWKFVLAFALGLAVVWSQMPILAAAALMTLSVVLVARSLEVLAADPRRARALRPREHATWDGTIAALIAAVAIGLSAAGHTGGAAIAGVAAVVLAGLRLRTRYVAR